jgi:hypothetical protein
MSAGKYFKLKMIAVALSSRFSGDTVGNARLSRR